VTRNLVKSGLKGAQNVEAITNEPFETTLARWAISLYVNDYFSSGSDSYGFYQLNLAGGYSGVALPGFNPVSLDAGNNFAVSLKRYGALGFVKRSSGMPSTNFELDSFGRKVNIWMFDQR
jgi:hypothetical protein